MKGDLRNWLEDDMDCDQVCVMGGCGCVGVYQGWVWLCSMGSLVPSLYFASNFRSDGKIGPGDIGGQSH